MAPVTPSWPSASTASAGVSTGGGSGETVTRISSLTLNWVSSAVSRSSYSPTTPKEAVVTGLAGSAKTTGPGPLTTLHVVVSWPLGKPSSEALPCSCTLVAGRVTPRSGPASTVGAAFCSFTTMVTSSLTEWRESSAVSRST